MTDRSSDNLLQVPVDELRPGMFVAELDRPWLETPFALQGFYVRDAVDIDDLRKHCAHVFVDFTAPPPHADAEAPIPPIRSRPMTLWQRIVAWLRGRLPRVERDDDSDGVVSFVAELPNARRAVDAASTALRDAIGRVGEGQPLDVKVVRSAVETVVDSLLRNKDAVAALVRMRKVDDYTYQHALATSVWAVLLGRHLGLDRDALMDLGLGGALLDLGKSRMPSDLLSRPAALEEDDWAVMRMHVEIALELIEDSTETNENIEAMIATHHERHDGSGYPHGIVGTAIPVFGRIAGIADSYDAMISRRPWAAAVSSFAAMRELQGLADSHFQAEMVEQFMQAIGSFPAGTLVELSTGEVAIVIAENAARRLRPKVMLILDEHKRPRDRNLIIDLYRPDAQGSKGAGAYILHGLEAGAYDIDAESFFL
ncbi:MAG TPA: HD domain-containing phosphohydrolase [Pseudomonadales bacterium]|nr:HD domain-containing phosphohydrolase [Pseudomonadales bacterium]